MLALQVSALQVSALQLLALQLLALQLLELQSLELPLPERRSLAERSLERSLWVERWRSLELPLLLAWIR